MLFGTQQHQPKPSNPFVLNWGVHHEKNGVASVLQGFQNVSAQLASKHQLSIPSSVCAHEQDLQFVSHDHPFLQGTVFGVPSAQYAIAASPDAKLVGGGSEMLLEVKCVCPFVEKDDGRGWVWLPFKRAPQGVSVKHFVQCQVQMLATSVSHCLLARWDVQECKVFYVPFDEVWCRQMVSMLSTIFLAAAPLSGRSPNYAAIPLHKEFVGYTIELCSALQELCSVDSVKGAVNARWV